MIERERRFDSAGGRVACSTLAVAPSGDKNQMQSESNEVVSPVPVIPDRLILHGLRGCLAYFGMSAGVACHPGRLSYTCLSSPSYTSSSLYPPFSLPTVLPTVPRAAARRPFGRPHLPVTLPSEPRACAGLIPSRALPIPPCAA